MLTLNIVTFSNLLLLFSLLFFRKNNALPNKILALILIDPGINFLSNVTVLSGYFFDFPYIFFFAQVTAFAFAPLVHMYIRLLTGRKIHWKYPMYIITGLAMLMVVSFGVEFFFMSDEQQAVYLTGLMNEPYPLQMNITNSIFILLQQIYFTLAAIEVYRYQKHLSDNLSNFEKTKISYTVKFIVLIWLLNLITIGAYAVLPMTQVEYIVLPTVVTLIYFFILYYSFHHHSIFTYQSYEEFLSDNTLPEKDSPQACKIDNTLQDAELLLTAQQVEDYLYEKEPFINPDLTLETLSKEMDIPCGKISAAINKALKKNFYELINEKRVEKSKQLLQKRAGEFTVEYIAYESGFNSRASFYRAFKKHTEITPKEFLKVIEEK